MPMEEQRSIYGHLEEVQNGTVNLLSVCYSAMLVLVNENLVCWISVLRLKLKNIHYTSLYNCGIPQQKGPLGRGNEFWAKCTTL